MACTVTPPKEATFEGGAWLARPRRGERSAVMSHPPHKSRIRTGRVVIRTDTWIATPPLPCGMSCQRYVKQKRRTRTRLGSFTIERGESVHRGPGSYSPSGQSSRIRTRFFFLETERGFEREDPGRVIPEIN